MGCKFMCAIILVATMAILLFSNVEACAGGCKGPCICLGSGSGGLRRRGILGLGGGLKIGLKRHVRVPTIGVLPTQYLGTGGSIETGGFVENGGSIGTGLQLGNGRSSSSLGIEGIGGLGLGGIGLGGLGLGSIGLGGLGIGGIGVDNCITDDGGWFGTKPETTQEWFGVKPATTSGWFGVQPATTSGWFGVQPATTSGWFGVKPATTSGWFGVKPATTSGWFGAKPKTTSGWFGVKPATTSGWSGVQPATTSGWSGVQPATTSGWFGAKPAITSRWFPVKPATTSRWFPVKPATQAPDICGLCQYINKLGLCGNKDTSWYTNICAYCQNSNVAIEDNRWQIQWYMQQRLMAMWRQYFHYFYNYIQRYNHSHQHCNYNYLISVWKRYINQIFKTILSSNEFQYCDQNVLLETWKKYCQYLFQIYFGGGANQQIDWGWENSANQISGVNLDICSICGKHKDHGSSSGNVVCGCFPVSESQQSI